MVLLQDRKTNQQLAHGQLRSHQLPGKPICLTDGHKLPGNLICLNCSISKKKTVKQTDLLRAVEPKHAV
jgi:ribosomal protein L32